MLVKEGKGFKKKKDLTKKKKRKSEKIMKVFNGSNNFDAQIGFNNFSLLNQTNVEYQEYQKPPSEKYVSMTAFIHYDKIL